MERLSDTSIEIINELHTERLDYSSEYIPLIDAANRLADYEDTGLEPEDVRRLQQDWTSLIMTLDEMGGMPNLHELVQAEKDGRLVVLPCKVGDTVYVIDKGDYTHAFKPYVRSKTVREISRKATSRKDLGWGLILAGGDCGTSARYKLSSIGKTVFLTRQEAEAALAQKGGEG